MSSDYYRIGLAIRYLEDHYTRQPDLNEVARATGLSVFHFQRLFKRWVGISPKQFLKYVTLEYTKKLLNNSESLLETAFAGGLSGTGRLHDLFVSLQACSPGEYKNRGSGLSIQCGFVDSPFGKCFLAVTARGLCGLAFMGEEGENEVLDWLTGYWARAVIVRDDQAMAQWRDQVFTNPARDRYSDDSTPGTRPVLPLFVRGTSFQVKVWEALLRIPPGCVTTYTRIAEAVGRPSASRAVANAVGANPVSYLIPCHRVIRKSGALGGYRWGLSRKRSLLGYEVAKRNHARDILFRDAYLSR